MIRNQTKVFITELLTLHRVRCLLSTYDGPGFALGTRGSVADTGDQKLCLPGAPMPGGSPTLGKVTSKGHLIPSAFTPSLTQYSILYIRLHLKLIVNTVF